MLTMYLSFKEITNSNYLPYTLNISKKFNQQGKKLLQS